MKYVMLRLKKGNQSRLVPVIFPASLVHKDVATAITEALKKTGDCEVVSAGECTVDVMSAHGRSSTLGVAARSEDTEIINGIDYFHGIE
jgi:hypothetical protein